MRCTASLRISKSRFVDQSSSKPGLQEADTSSLYLCNMNLSISTLNGAQIQGADTTKTRTEQAYLCVGGIEKVQKELGFSVQVLAERR